jgi:hypothetical protein
MAGSDFVEPYQGLSGFWKTRRFIFIFGPAGSWVPAEFGQP